MRIRHRPENNSAVCREKTDAIHPVINMEIKYIRLENMDWKERIVARALEVMWLFSIASLSGLAMPRMNLNIRMNTSAA